jgi:hypothetical protein
MSRRFQRRAWRRPRPDEMAGGTAQTSAVAPDARGADDKDFAARLIKLEHHVAVLTEVLADLVPVIKHWINIHDGPGQRMTKDVAMQPEIRIGDDVMFLENRAVPDVQSVGLVGQVVDPGHKPPDASKVYVRFPNGREFWVDRGSLVHAPKQDRSDP